MRYVALILLVTGCASTPKEASWLFVQNAERAELKAGKLTLTGIDPSVVCFTDRPQRRTGTITTQKFVGGWDEGGVFVDVPPNATLAVFASAGVRGAVVVLRNPHLVGRTLIYDAEVLEGSATVAGPAALFIDSVGSNTPVVRHGMHDEPGVIFRRGGQVIR
ncbi:MAG: hypothetical protein ACYTEG_05550 [Planctomycetota bacterium]